MLKRLILTWHMHGNGQGVAKDWLKKATPSAALKNLTHSAIKESFVQLDLFWVKKIEALK
ncbi:hypothetical protein [Helicobacter suis]|uniref:hypothetical protein n=1 Tax=Helicobacter suis TaxID=104628 RepID=UPI0013D0B8A0|nr:hypothetical protein [Helicobacter suis]